MPTLLDIEVLEGELNEYAGDVQEMQNSIDNITALKVLAQQLADDTQDELTYCIWVYNNQNNYSRALSEDGPPPPKMGVNGRNELREKSTAQMYDLFMRLARTDCFTMDRTQRKAIIDTLKMKDKK